MSEPCRLCGRPPTKLGHDACIANLPGVRYACCGHGDRHGAYVQFENGTVIRGFDVIEGRRFQVILQARVVLSRMVGDWHDRIASIADILRGRAVAYHCQFQHPRGKHVVERPRARPFRDALAARIHGPSDRAH